MTGNNLRSIAKDLPVTEKAEYKWHV
jgi:hypothetical protein